MKHLKSFNESAEDRVIVEMEDRLVDLEDMGYDINVATEDFGECYGYTVYISNKSNRFSYDTIKEQLYHLEQFMEVYGGYKPKLKGDATHSTNNKFTTNTMTKFMKLQFYPEWYFPFA